MIFLVKYEFANAAGELRQGGVIVDAKDSEAAKKTASEKLAAKYTVHKIKKITPY